MLVFCYHNVKSVALLVGGSIHVLSESAGGERIFEPACVRVGVQVKMKVYISDEDAVGMISGHVLNKRCPLPKRTLVLSPF